MLCGYIFQRVHDAVAPLAVKRHELPGVGKATPGRRRIVAAVLSRQETTSQRAPDQDANVVVLSERLELIFEASANEAVIHLRCYISLQPEAILQHDSGGRLP